jgi:hypothetical protein
MGRTADTIFGIYKLDSTDAGFYLRKNRIEIGKDTITLETLIHEISELETMVLLDKLEGTPVMKLTINGYRNNVSHFVSPYGKNSLLNPCLELEGRPTRETFLEE